MRSGALILIGLVGLFLGEGCALSPGGYPEGETDSLRGGMVNRARAGDPVAQTALGDSYCCFGRGKSIVDATRWYCEAATQGHAQAYYQLGRVYEGEAGRSLFVASRRISIPAGRRDRGLARFFYAQAARLGFPPAGRKGAALDLVLNAEEQLAAGGYAAEPSAAPCRYDRVFQGYSAR